MFHSLRRLCVLRASVVNGFRRLYHHGGTENTEGELRKTSNYETTQYSQTHHREETARVEQIRRYDVTKQHNVCPCP